MGSDLEIIGIEFRWSLREPGNHRLVVIALLVAEL